MHGCPYGNRGKRYVDMIRILIADDHAIVREGLKQIVQQTSDIIVVDEASNAGETLEKVRKLKLDLLLLDISMPAMELPALLYPATLKSRKIALLGPNRRITGPPPTAPVHVSCE